MCKGTFKSVFLLKLHISAIFRLGQLEPRVSSYPVYCTLSVHPSGSVYDCQRIRSAATLANHKHAAGTLTLTSTFDLDL